MAARTAFLTYLTTLWQRLTGRCPCEYCTLEDPAMGDISIEARQLLNEAAADYRQMVESGALASFDEHAKRQYGMIPDAPAAFTTSGDAE